MLGITRNVVASDQKGCASKTYRSEPFTQGAAGPESSVWVILQFEGQAGVSRGPGCVALAANGDVPLLCAAGLGRYRPGYVRRVNSRGSATCTAALRARQNASMRGRTIFCLRP